jgi:hypothetical protein
MNPKSDLDGERGATRDSAEIVDVEIDEREEMTSSAELPRPANTAPTRPDLGPPAPGPQSTNQPGSGLGLVISVAIAALVFAMSIIASGAPTTNPLPLAQTTSALYWIVGALATVAAGVGAVYADRTASRARNRENLDRPPATTAWIVPVVATATAIILVATFHNQAMFVAGPLIAFLGNAGALLSRDLLDDADDSAQRTAAVVHVIVIGIVAFFALTAIYLNKMPTPFTALLAGAVTALLGVEVLERSAVDDARKIVLALLAGAAVAAASVPLMWWPTHGLTGGGVLFVVFYFTIGVIQTGVERRGWLPRDGILYGLLPLAMFIVLVITA